MEKLFFVAQNEGNKVILTGMRLKKLASLLCGLQDLLAWLLTSIVPCPVKVTPSTSSKTINSWLGNWLTSGSATIFPWSSTVTWDLHRPAKMTSATTNSPFGITTLDGPWLQWHAFCHAFMNAYTTQVTQVQNVVFNILVWSLVFFLSFVRFLISNHIKIIVV